MSRDTSGVKSAVNECDVLIVGKVVKTEMFEESTNQASPWNSVLKRRIYIRVTKVYKGVTTKEIITVVTGMGDADCGYTFEKRKKYILYGYYAASRHSAVSKDTPKYLTTNICTRTTKYNQWEAKMIEKYL